MTTVGGDAEAVERVARAVPGGRLVTDVGADGAALVFVPPGPGDDENAAALAAARKAAAEEGVGVTGVTVLGLRPGDPTLDSLATSGAARDALVALERGGGGPGTLTPIEVVADADRSDRLQGEPRSSSSPASLAARPEIRPLSACGPAVGDDPTTLTP